MNKKKAQRRFVFACLAPAVILVILFMVIPTFNVFRYSLYGKTGIVGDAPFVGLNNFKILFTDSRFIESMQNMILIIVMVTLFTVVLAVLFATLLTREEFKGKNFFRVIFYIPNILSIVVIAGIFSAIYAPDNGLLNSFLEMIGLGMLQKQWWEIPVSYCIPSSLHWCGRQSATTWSCIWPACPPFRKICMRRLLWKGQER